MSVSSSAADSMNFPMMRNVQCECTCWKAGMSGALSRRFEEVPACAAVDRLPPDSALAVVDSLPESLEYRMLLLVQGEPVDRIWKDGQASNRRQPELLL